MSSRRRIETIDELMDSLCDPGTLDDSAPNFDDIEEPNWSWWQRAEVVFFAVVGIAFWLVLGAAVVSLFQLF